MLWALKFTKMRNGNKILLSQKTIRLAHTCNMNNVQISTEAHKVLKEEERLELLLLQHKKRKGYE